MTIQGKVSESENYKIGKKTIKLKNKMKWLKRKSKIHWK